MKSIFNSIIAVYNMIYVDIYMDIERQYTNIIVKRTMQVWVATLTTMALVGITFCSYNIMIDMILPEIL